MLCFEIKQSLGHIIMRLKNISYIYTFIDQHIQKMEFMIFKNMSPNNIWKQNGKF